MRNVKPRQLPKGRKPSERNKLRPDDAVRYVLVRPGEAPIVTGARHHELLEVFQKAVGGLVEEVPYPSHLKGARKYVMLANDAGLLRGLPANRWGIVGAFVVVGRGGDDWRGLTEDEANGIVEHLGPAGGRLTQRTPLAVTGAAFKIPPDIPDADGFIEEESDWEPHLHFTGVYAESPNLVAAINEALAKQADDLAAYHLMPCFGMKGTFSLELQFHDDEDAAETFRACVESRVSAEYLANVAH